MTHMADGEGQAIVVLFKMTILHGDHSAFLLADQSIVQPSHVK